MTEMAFTRRLCARHAWPVIDVTRRSIEETAAAVIKLYARNAKPRFGRRARDLRRG